MTTTQITNNLLKTVAYNNYIIARNATTSATVPAWAVYAVLATVAVAALVAVLWVAKDDIEYFFWDIQYRRKHK